MFTEYVNRFNNCLYRLLIVDAVKATVSFRFLTDDNDVIKLISSELKSPAGMETYYSDDEIVFSAYM